MQRKSLTYGISIAIILTLSAFKTDDRVRMVPDRGNDTASVEAVSSVKRTSVLTSSPVFGRFSDSLYEKIASASTGMPSKKVFTLAMKGYAALLYRSALQNCNLITIIDYSVSSNNKRLWVIDLSKCQVLFHELVAHGRNSGNEYAKSFSNQKESYKSSLGFYVTGDIYEGKHAMSLRLNGLEKSYNSNALDRGIVMHGADYVSPDFIKQNQRLGRSQGCPAVSQDVIASIASLIQNGSCVFAYYPHKSYMRYSRLLNTSTPFLLPAAN